MSYVLGSLVGIAAVELFLRLPFLPIVKAIATSARKAIRVIGSGAISDHWKERVVLRYAMAMLASTLRLGLCFLALVALVAGLALAAGRLAGVSLFAVLASVDGALVVSAVSAAYGLARSRFA